MPRTRKYRRKRRSRRRRGGGPCLCQQTVVPQLKTLIMQNTAIYQHKINELEHRLKALEDLTKELEEDRSTHIFRLDDLEQEQERRRICLIKN